MSEIYKLRKSECETLAEIFSIELDPSKYSGLNVLQSELDRFRKILVTKIKHSAIVAAEVARQIKEAREANPEENIKWDIQSLKTAVNEHDKITAEEEGTGPRTNLNSKSETSSPPPPPFRMTEEALNELISAIRNNQDKTIALPNFEGNLEDDIQEHVEMFEKLCTLNRWDDRTKKNNFIKTFKKNALEYMMTKVIQADEVISWEDMKNKIIRKYKKDEDSWELVISQTSQKDNEDPQNYATKIERLCKKMNPNMSEKAIVSKIIKGVLPSIRKELLHRNIKTMDDLEDNLEQIRANKIRYKDEGVDILNELVKLRTDLLEKKEIVSPMPSQKKEEPNSYAQAISRPPSTRGYSNRGKYQGGSRRPYMPRFQNQIFTQQRGPCYFCGGPNHHAAVCRKKRSAFCTTCGKQGHYVDTCWYTIGLQQGVPTSPYRGQGRGRRGFHLPPHQLPKQQPQTVNSIPAIKFEETTVSKNE